MFKLVVLLSVAAMAAAKPGAVLAPLAYSAGVVPAVSSVSQYRTDVVHGSPALYGTPTVYAAGPAVYPARTVYAPSVVAPVALAQAPHSPAVVLDAVNGVPLDTPEVVAARAAHYQAKVVAAHHVGKRSVVAPLTYSSVVSPLTYSTPLVSTYSAYPNTVLSTYSSPVLTSNLPLYPKALSVHPY